MVKKARSSQRREDSLSRDRIIEASIELLDGGGEGGLTFRTLSERLATGPGAIYWHIADKGDLLVAACDAVIARTIDACTDGETPADIIRGVALSMFDAMDEHPWIGSALLQSAGQRPTVRLIECIGQQVQAFGIPTKAQWAAASALLHYILGVGGQNASNRLSAQSREIDRKDFLGEVSAAWSELDEGEYPFTRSMAKQLRDHDDRGDFLAGIDLILVGITGLAEKAARVRAPIGRRTAA